jgi:NADH dehydrogenase [ubiquinone] 1 alpha subcomplex assembly factor 7
LGVEFLTEISTTEPMTEFVVEHIRKEGPIRFDRFWDLALTHPAHGYYTAKPHAIGGKGDFITAPEISQLFGEMIGLWLVRHWIRLGRPEVFTLIECGAGRGTLMADLLRATAHIPQFHSALKIVIVEVSPVMRSLQKTTLQGFSVEWCDGIDDVNTNHPVMIIGNEFLDALSIRQFEYTDERWLERYVTVDKNKLCFMLKAMDFDKALFPKALCGDVFERSPKREVFINLCAEMVKNNSGAALFIDYGHTQTAIGDTVQALKDHRYVGIFDCVGESDLTSHVDFEVLAPIPLQKGLSASPVITQNRFLYALGIHARAKILLSKANDEQAARIRSGLHRLTAPDQMGELFKVMEFYA